MNLKLFHNFHNNQEQTNVQIDNRTLQDMGSIPILLKVPPLTERIKS